MGSDPAGSETGMRKGTLTNWREGISMDEKRNEATYEVEMSKKEVEAVLHAFKVTGNEMGFTETDKQVIRKIAKLDDRFVAYIKDQNWFPALFK